MPVRFAWSRGHRLVLLVALAAVAGNCGKGDDVTGPPDPPGTPAVATVEIAPNPVNLSVGQETQLTATLKAADGTVLSDRAVAWTTNNPAIATISEDGVVTGTAEGEATITASSEGRNGAVTVTVSAAHVASVNVVPHPSSVLLGQTAQLTAVILGEGGEELSGRPVTWSSSDQAIATVSGTGLVTGVAVGAATITATSEGQEGSSALTVSSVAVSTVEVAPPSSEVDIGGRVQLTATAKDAAGAVLVGRPAAWTTSDAGIARVNPTGRVTGIGVGNATITATIEGKTATATVTVSRQPVATVAITPEEVTLAVQGAAQLRAIVKAANGTELSGRAVTWTSSEDPIARVSSTGLVTGIAAGTATITATSEGVSGTATVSVTPVSGLIRTWRGGTAGRLSDWSAPANWTPAGEPIALDTVRVPPAANPPVLSEDVQIARVLIVGGRVRLAGHRLRVTGSRISVAFTGTE